MKFLLHILVAAGTALFGAAAQAQGYPTKPITIVVPFGPGSGTDTIARIIGQRLGVALNQSIVIENKPGGNGTISAAFVARAAPDGYTLFMGTNTPLSAAPFLVKSISYDPVKDFVALTRVGSFTQMLVVNPSIPAKTVQELVAYVKANPGKLTFLTMNGAAESGVLVAMNSV